MALLKFLAIKFYNIGPRLTALNTEIPLGGQLYLASPSISVPWIDQRPWPKMAGNKKMNLPNLYNTKWLF
jgi:hypothetical protein